MQSQQCGGGGNQPANQRPLSVLMSNGVAEDLHGRQRVRARSFVSCKRIFLQANYVKCSLSLTFEIYSRISDMTSRKPGWIFPEGEKRIIRC